MGTAYLPSSVHRSGSCGVRITSEMVIGSCQLLLAMTGWGFVFFCFSLYFTPCEWLARKHITGRIGLCRSRSVVWFRVSRRRSMSQHQGYTATAIVRFCQFCHFSSKSSHTDITSIVLMESVYVEDILFWQRSASGLHGGRGVGLLSGTYSSHLRPL